KRRVEPVKPTPAVIPKIEISRIPDWPFDADEARRRQARTGQTHRIIDLGKGIKIEMVLIPAGRFVMGDKNGYLDECRLTSVNVKRAFWMSRFEVTNEQYARFNPSHDSKYEHKGSWMFNEWDLGWALNEPGQPVVRVSWKEASEFCRWLSKKTGQNVSLPSEAQWEWACRAGTDTPLYYGDLDTDFSQFGNMADFTIRELVYDVRDQYTPDIVPRDARFNDKRLVTAEVGSYKPNAWGLYDMHGNVWEWTRSVYEPYPYSDYYGSFDNKDTGQRVVRGGSWYDRPKRCRSASRLSYPEWQKVYNVGFRIILEVDDQTQQFVSNK
ncbi:MAG: formylglycine-generating enzyme family protein, partial [Planctomycetota bacterium]